MDTTNITPEDEHAAMATMVLIQTIIYGEAIGDALGVPYEFRERGTFTCTGMVGGGAHRQPAGTYSDDTALMLATLDSLLSCDGTVNEDDMRVRFLAWLDDGKYSADGTVFDVGGATQRALRAGRGMSGERDNGNGSLMRIVPCALFDLSDSDIRRASAVTHAHPISMDACVTLVHIARELIDMVDVREALAHNGFDGLWHKSRNEIESDGFVLHTLEAALWCLCTTQSYADCVLEAVNLGSDTDTTAAVAGALAAIVYGFEDEGEPSGIPEEWMDALRGQEQFLDVILGGPEDVETDPNGAYGDDPLSDERMPLDLDGDQLVASTSSAGLDLFDDARDLCSQAAMMSDEETRAQSFAQAAETLIKAYQVGMFEAAQVLGILYYERHVQAADADAQAFLWFGRGCEHGLADCACYLGDMLRDGRGPDHEPDAQAALDYYNLAFDLAQERFDLDDLDDLASFAIIALRLGESYERRVQDGLDSAQAGDFAFMHYAMAATIAERVVRLGARALGKELRLAQDGVERMRPYASPESLEHERM
ncbi:ADP-ribosylglycohydrolase family protein [Bifidobacterium pseudolongum subsp. globosum]|uniref:ADP-ribosylglycohydrolase family protein n=1 Tax=Bifidobacterium pseudolongum TaxID=1694 RepID=UPI000BBFDA91|nr:ADP-ribosylglycohydrolase family protein [Bifidobacterium pseudolongum]ASW23413.1 ADP-ribosylglycohydrolase family protein [Bifidobacterium pseudolongum]MCI1194986.1 ADP-ribosylglycohydrolase family protein [Bifidobacterium pseudolongum subsp. globosum]UNP93456.1 ADP-ribosylglycohydrolase family protein [Bifidobacterium pseudolongum subsp. globosum]UNZ10064.1 ADP-ribosylglycohydrolase family protein [Bifidobacterium pseudolongum subsp. globosum]